MSTQVQILRDRSDALSAELNTLLAADIPASRAAADAANGQIEAKIEERKTVDARLAKLENDEQRRGAGADAERRLGIKVSASGTLRTGDTVYGRDSGNSYFKDLLASAMPGNPQAYEAQQRLNEHAQVIDRAAEDLPPEWRATPTRRAAGSNLEQRVNPNRTDGQGGFFVPPLWLVDEYVALLRAGRSTADRCNVRELPPGTDVVSLPKVATGTATAVQTADAAAVQSTDLTDTSVTGPVRTIAGQQDVALQLIEQSPGNFDEVVFADLIADYNQKLDIQVINGTGASGQMKGILPTSGINAITYTSGTPTLPTMWVPLTQSLSLVSKLRFLSADTIAMHPSIWWWMVSQLDSTNRPLIAPQAGNGLNSLAVFDATASEGVVGAIGPVQIIADANLPTNLGAGTNETRIISGRLKDAWLYEGALRTRALVEVLSGTLQVRLQVYNYTALIADRYPTAYSVISGTGLIPAAGF